MAALGLFMIFKVVFLCQPKPWRRYTGTIQPDAATASLPAFLSLPALPSKLQRVLWAKPSLSTWENTFGSRLPCLQAFCCWFAFAQPVRAKSSPTDPRELQPGVSLAQDVSITKLSKPISSEQTDLKSQRRQFINCWMLAITANKHQRQESLAGDEKSCPVMRGYEPFLSYLFGFYKEKPDVAAVAHAEQPLPKPLLGAGVPWGWQNLGPMAGDAAGGQTALDPLGLWCGLGQPHGRAGA